MFKTILIGAVCVLSISATAAMASAERLSDAQYVEAGRCQALMSAPTLGGGDSHAIDQLVRQADRGRSPMAVDLAQQARDDAAEQARTAGAYRKSQLSAERDGVCRAMLSTPAAFAKTN
jgi:hypothetical protein